PNSKNFSKTLVISTKKYDSSSIIRKVQQGYKIIKLSRRSVEILKRVKSKNKIILYLVAMSRND
ncbi:MAG: hypothetical protein ACFFCG_06805, partial [Promethearchaeota archaeon]